RSEQQGRAGDQEKSTRHAGESCTPGNVRGISRGDRSDGGLETLRLLQTLSDAFGVTGFEDEARETLRTLVQPYADEIRTDVLGNLLVTRRGGSEFTVMLDAHLDEIGLIVKHIDER